MYNEDLAPKLGLTDVELDNIEAGFEGQPDLYNNTDPGSKYYDVGRRVAELVGLENLPQG
jgi:hypothetical protein